MLRNARNARLDVQPFRSALQRLQFSSEPHPAQRKETEGQQEVEGAAEGASFFGTGVKAAAHTLKEKVASAVGMSDKKPLSDNEDMGAAGHMQGRHRDARQVYDELSEKTKKGWKESGRDEGPPQQYPAHGRNT